MSTCLNLLRGSAVIALAIAGACSDASTSSANHPLTLSVTTQSQGVLADVTIGAGTSSLVISKAQLLARRIELAPADAAGCAGTEESSDEDSSGGDGCAEVETGPTLIDLPLDATTKTSISAAVPAGSYRALEMRIGPITSGNRSSSAFVVAHPEFKDVSVRIEGTYNGQAFVFTAPVNASVESAFSTPVTVDANNPNVTIAIDIASWFSDGSGGTLDPSNSANGPRISGNIARSFHAFEDDDHDGHDDHQR
jgi:hypothetical protein